jgi:hypothetical protein
MTGKAARCSNLEEASVPCADMVDADHLVIESSWSVLPIGR